jgi:dihydrofolate synthase/folylpolyglutamate synthase
MPIEKIKNRANKNKLQFKAYQSSLNAYNDALTESDLNDLIFVTGSNFVVSEILKSF